MKIKNNNWPAGRTLKIINGIFGVCFAAAFGFLTTCSFGGSELEEDTTLQPGEFWATTIEDKWYRVQAEELARGEHCVVWGEKGRGLTPVDGQNVIAEFDANIYGKITKTFGEIEDVDKNGKVILLLLHIKDGYDKDTNPAFVGGYFQQQHMKKRTAQYPHSNEADMLFININPDVQKPGSPGCFATIAHELVHLIHYSQRQAKGLSPKDLWINEGLATAAEYLYGSGDPNERILHQLHVNNNINMRITETMQKDTFYIWDNSIEDYSTAYLFFQWLRIHAKNDAGIYKEILNDKNSDYQCVLNSVRDEFAQVANWEWEDVLKQWFLSNYYSNNEEKSLPGYGGFSLIKDTVNALNLQLLGSGKIIETLAKPVDFDSSKQISLKSGEAVFSNINVQVGDHQLPENAPDIKYIGIKSTKEEYSTPPFFQNDVLLTYNMSSNSNATQFAYVPKGYPPLSAKTSVIGGARSAFDANSPAETVNIPRQPQMIDLHFSVNSTVGK